MDRLRWKEDGKTVKKLDIFNQLRPDIWNNSIACFVLYLKKAKLAKYLKMPLQNFWAHVFHRSCGWFINIITNVTATFDNISSVVIIPAAAVWEPKWQRTPASPKVVASGNLETHEGLVAFYFGLGTYLQGAIQVQSSWAQFRIIQTTLRLTSHPIWRCFAWGKKAYDQD